MTHLFDDITITEGAVAYDYRCHRLETADAYHHGFATAALVAVWLVGTDDGARRGIGSLNSREDRQRLMECYEEETIREDGGLLMDEVEEVYWWLWNIAVDEQEPDNHEAIFRMSRRQWELWTSLIREYMTRLAERWAENVLAAEDNVNESGTYIEWLLRQLAAYTRVQYIRSIDWCDREQVQCLWGMQQAESGWMVEWVALADTLTHLPADVAEDGLMKRYHDLRKAEHAARRIPPTGAEWYEAEKAFLPEDEVLAYIDPAGQKELADSHKRWLRWLGKKVRVVTPTNVPVIWDTEFVDERLEKKLTDHLLAQEEDDVEWCKQLTAAIFAMKIDRYIRRELKAPEFRKWAAVYLKKDYTIPSVRVQLDRRFDKWNRLDTPVQQQLHFIRNYR